MSGGQLKGRTGLVTGASSGLGMATAKALAAAGADVALHGRNADALDGLRAEIEAMGCNASIHVVDLMAPGSGSELVADAIKSHNGGLDLLVNNAALFHAGKITDGGQPDQWAAMLRVNVMALLEAAQAAGEHMRSHGRPSHIVNIASLSSRMEGGGVYGASKAAVDYISAQLRYELERDAIRCVTIVPGAFPTQLGRNLEPAQLQGLMGAFTAFDSPPDADGRTALVGSPQDIANAVVYAVSQPIHLNIAEMIVRPAANVPVTAFN